MTNVQIKEIPKDTEVNRILHDEMTDEFQKRYVLVGEEDTCLPIHYERYAEPIENFEVRNSDVWVCSYPKTGTTWTQEMVWLIGNSVDFERAKTELTNRFPFFEVSILTNLEAEEKYLEGSLPENIANSIEYTSRLKDPRFLKTHLPFFLLPKEIRSGLKTPKMIYVVRNPKDVCVSYFHHCRLFQGCKANIEDFAKVFLADKTMYGAFWKHVFGYWNKQDLPNLLIIKYEDMKKDLPAVIKKVATFLDKQLTNQQIEQLAKHLSFESMKNNKAVNGDDFLAFRKLKNLTFGNGSFIRAGEVGKYKEELLPETVEKLNAWIKENVDGTVLSQLYDFDL